MVEWIKIEQSDLNSLSYRKAKPEEKAILLDLIGLAMTEDIELPYNSIDNLIEYEELANLLNVKPTSLANTIRKFEKFIQIEKFDDVITLKLKFVEIAKDKISEKSSKAQNAAKTRWNKEREKSKNSDFEYTSNANEMQTHNTSNANEMQRREDKRREDKRREEENKYIPDFSKKSVLTDKPVEKAKNLNLNNSFSKQTNDSKQELTPKKVKTPFDINYSHGFTQFWTAFNKRGSKTKAYEYWQKFKLENQLERVLEAVQIYNTELSDEKFRKHAEGFLNGLLATYFDKLEDPKSIILPEDKQKELDEQIQEKRDLVRYQWISEMGDLERKKQKTMEFNDWLALNNMPELIKVYTYTN